MVNGIQILITIMYKNSVIDQQSRSDKLCASYKVKQIWLKSSEMQFCNGKFVVHAAVLLE